MTSPDEALRLAQEVVANYEIALSEGIEVTELRPTTVLFAQALIALSPRSCSECAEFKRLQEECKILGDSLEAWIDISNENKERADQAEQRAEAAERKLGELREANKYGPYGDPNKDPDGFGGRR